MVNRVIKNNIIKKNVKNAQGTFWFGYLHYKIVS